MKSALLVWKAILMPSFTWQALAGKQHFCQMLVEAFKEFGQVTGKISTWGVSRFDPAERYSGIVIYKLDGKLKFRYPAHRWGGRFFHVSLQNVSDWPQGAVRPADAGLSAVHDFHHTSFTGLHLESGRTCSAGFSIEQGVIEYSSLWLNPKRSSGCESDGSSNMSDIEQAFLKPLIEAWMRGDTAFTWVFPDSFLRAHCPHGL